MSILPLQRRSYAAKLFTVFGSDLEFRVAGTLDGFIDFAVSESTGTSATYSITCADARMLIATLNSAVDDVQEHCLFDRDPLLVKGYDIR